MNYFLIYRTEDGVMWKQFGNKERLKEYLQEYLSDSPIEFLQGVPEDYDDFLLGNVVVIKGEIILPNPVSIVKSYEIK